MKKNLLFAMLGVTIVLFTASCSKSDPDPAPANNVNLVGTWTGTGQYGTTPGGTAYVFSLTFKATGSVDITGNNSTVIENATGTWEIIQDSVHVIYTYASSSAIYKLSGKYSSNSNVMVGTIGLNPVTTGVGLFSVTKQ